MKLYVVAYIDWYDHELITEEVYANSKEEAMMSHSKIMRYDYSEIDKTEEALKQFFFDCDSMVHAHLVKQGKELKP